MAELEEKLNAILGDQQAMGQIMALARSLSGGGGQSGEGNEVPLEEPASRPEDSARGHDGGMEGMPDLASLFGQVDPAMLQTGMRLLREYQGGDDRNAALLEALRPFLREERRAKLDRALQIARMTRLIRIGLSAAGGKEGEGRV